MPLCNWLALALNSKGEGWMGSRREINELAEAKTRIIGVGQFLKQRDINFCFFFFTSSYFIQSIRVGEQ